MSIPTTIQDLSSSDLEIIRRKARQLVRRWGFHSQEGEDLEQELTCHLWSRLRAFDPSQGTRNAFVATVIENCAANILRDRRAQKRSACQTVSLQARLGQHDEGARELADTVAEDAHSQRIGRYRGEAQEQSDLRIDVQDLLKGCPQAQRDLAQLLMTESLSDAARTRGLPRTTLANGKRQLLKLFEDAGLETYLKKQPSSLRESG